MTDQLTDAQLSERVCKALGIEPKREWHISTAGNMRDSYTPHTTKQGAEDLLRYLIDRYSYIEPKWKEATITEKVFYPNVLGWPGFGLMVEKLREHGIKLWDVEDLHGKYLVQLRSAESRKDGEAAADTLPRALAMAVIAMEESR